MPVGAVDGAPEPGWVVAVGVPAVDGEELGEPLADEPLVAVSAEQPATVRTVATAKVARVRLRREPVVIMATIRPHCRPAAKDLRITEGLRLRSDHRALAGRTLTLRGWPES